MVHEYKGNKLQLGLSILPTPTQICYSQLQHIYIIPLPTPTHITTLYSLLQPYIYKTTYSLLPHRYTTYYPYSHSYILLSTSYSHLYIILPALTHIIYLLLATPTHDAYPYFPLPHIYNTPYSISPT